MTNPLLEDQKNRDDAVAFDLVKVEHFLPAIDVAIKEARKNVAEIENSAETPTFENTVEALEVSAETLESITSVYFNLFSAEASEEHQKLAGEISAITSRYSNEVLLSEKLFTKIKQVYESREQLELTNEQGQLLKITYRQFVRNGALLSDEKKGELKQLDEELSSLGPQFSENVLKATNAFQMHVTDEEQLSGLPASSIQGAQEAAKDKGLEGWLFTLQQPSLAPFLKYADTRSLREEIWRAFRSRGMGQDTDNQPIAIKIAKLRLKRAQLLGFDSHAEYVLQERMAETPDKVLDFLSRIFEVAKPAALKELQELETFAKEAAADSKANAEPDGSAFEKIKPWDIAYYSEKLKQEKFQFNEEELKPWFPLSGVIQGAFETANRLYGLKFEKIDDVPTYHPDVEVFEVTDANQEYIGLFYTDFFPRETKRPGAWMTTYRQQGLQRGTLRRPHASIVCNFSKPSADHPSLLTMDEVRTLFHEFGHALHGLLSDCHYYSLSSPNVYWDFVELPSQIMENWVLEKEGLEFAKHYQTGAALDDSMIEKIKQASRFQAGMANLTQLSYGYLDMAWHHQTNLDLECIEEFEKTVLHKTSLFEHQPGTAISAAFSHIFSGGYSAGYYSYKWAEVLDADAFAYFKESGIFDREVADKFRTLLAKGGTEHPMELYKSFRGREPDPESLLRRDGLL